MAWGGRWTHNDMAMTICFDAPFDPGQFPISQEFGPATHVERRLAFLRRKFERYRRHALLYSFATTSVNCCSNQGTSAGSRAQTTSVGGKMPRPRNMLLGFISTTSLPGSVAACPSAKRMLPLRLCRPGNWLADALGSPVYGPWNGQSRSSPATPLSRNRAVRSTTLISQSLIGLEGEGPLGGPGGPLSKSPISFEFMARLKFG